jgi:hypothetical protein
MTPTSSQPTRSPVAHHRTESESQLRSICRMRPQQGPATAVQPCRCLLAAVDLPTLYRVNSALYRVNSALYRVNSELCTEFRRALPRVAPAAAPAPCGRAAGAVVLASRHRTSLGAPPWWPSACGR